jgi:hypothetical protein
MKSPPPYVLYRQIHAGATVGSLVYGVSPTGLLLCVNKHV